MKKIVSIVLTLVLLLSLGALTACDEPQEVVNIFVPDGAPALAVASLMKEGATINNHPVRVNISTGAGVKAAVVSGQADIAILPVSACVGLHKQQAADIKLFSVETWGNLYLVGKTDQGMEGLKGKVVHCIGQNDVPGIIFRSLLTHYGLEYVENSETPVDGKVAIVYYADASGFLPLLKQGKADYGVLGEPAASKVIGSPCVEVLDFQEAWAEKMGASYTVKGFPQAGMIVGKKYYSDNAFLTDLLGKMQSNDEYIMQFPTEVDALLTANGSATAASADLSRYVISRCNVKTVRGVDAKNVLDQMYPVYNLPTPNLDFYL